MLFGEIKKGCIYEFIPPYHEAEWYYLKAIELRGNFWSFWVLDRDLNQTNRTEEHNAIECERYLCESPYVQGDNQRQMEMENDFNRKVIRYELISCVDVNELGHTINEYLEDGWELYGNPFSFNREGSVTGESFNVFAQAMIKY